MAKKIKDIQYYEAVGRRNEAVARVRLYITAKDKTAQVNNKKYNQGDIVINEKPMKTVYNQLVEQKRLLAPFDLTNNMNRFVMSVNVRGGGRNGQLEAIILGVARALIVADDEEYSPILKQYGLLTRDPRMRERRKVGTGGKARRAKQSPKR